MRIIFLLFVFTLSSYLRTQVEQTSITNLIDQAHVLLEAKQAKKITSQTGQAQAYRLYDELREVFIENQKRPDFDPTVRGKVDEILFKLSNYFDLRTPIKDLAEHFKGAIQAGSLEWENINEQIAPTKFFDLLTTEKIKSYLQYILSGLGSIDVKKFFAMVPQILNISHDETREYYKNIYLMNGYIEPSPLNQERLANALIKTDYKKDVILLENPNNETDIAAWADSTKPFKIIALASRYFNNQTFSEFTLYHEIGHLYHQHGRGYDLLDMLPWQISFLSTLSIIGAAGLPYTAKVLAITTTIAIMLFDVLIAVLPNPQQYLQPCRRLWEREADLYACSQLIKQGHAQVVYDQIDKKLEQEALEHHELTYQIIPYLTETCPSYPERKRYLTDCLEKHGLHHYDLWKEKQENMWKDQTFASKISSLLWATNYHLNKLKTEPESARDQREALYGYNFLRELRELQTITSLQDIDHEWLAQQRYKQWKEKQANTWKEQTFAGKISSLLWATNYHLNKLKTEPESADDQREALYGYNFLRELRELRTITSLQDIDHEWLAQECYKQWKENQENMWKQQNETTLASHIGSLVSMLVNIEPDTSSDQKDILYAYNFLREFRELPPANSLQDIDHEWLAQQRYKQWKEKQENMWKDETLASKISLILWDINYHLNNIKTNPESVFSYQGALYAYNFLRELRELPSANSLQDIDHEWLAQQRYKQWKEKQENMWRDETLASKISLILWDINYHLNKLKAEPESADDQRNALHGYNFLRELLKLRPVNSFRDIDKKWLDNQKLK